MADLTKYCRLIDYSQLIDFLASLDKRCNEHELALREHEDIHFQQSETTAAQGKDIGRLSELAVSFQQGLDELHSMTDKVTAWNERFRLMEERNYQIYRDLNDVSLTMQRQIDALRDNVDSSSAEIVSKLQAEISLKHGHGEQNLAARYHELEEELETLKLQQKIGIERSQRDLAEKVKGFYDYMGVMAPNSSFDPLAASLNDAHQTPPPPIQDMARGNPLKVIASKVASLERKMFIAPTSSEQDISDLASGSKEEVLLELDHRFLFLSREVEHVKDLIHNVQSSSLPVKPPAQEPYVSLIEKVNELTKLKEAAPALLRLEQRVVDLAESFNNLAEKSDWQVSTPIFAPSPIKYRSSTDPNYKSSRISEQISTLALDSKQEGDETPPKDSEASKQNIEHYDKKLEELYDTINKVLKALPLMVSIADFEEMGALIKKMERQRRHEAAQSTEAEHAAKLEEIEQRLNKLWKQNYELGNLIQQVTAQTERHSHEILANTEAKISDVGVQLQTTQKELKKQLESALGNAHQTPTDFRSKEAPTTDHSFKAQISSLKRSQLETDERLERLEATLTGSPVLLNEAEEHLGEMRSSLSNMTTFQKFQAVLNQHDKSIRLLASRLPLGTSAEETTRSNRPDAAEVVGHLEDLRVEMQQLQAKYDANKSLSAKEMEKLNEIYSLLSNKSDRQELGRKVDKTELKRLERLLRKQIDKVNDAVKKAEDVTAHAGVDALFTKRRLDVDCAACGQELPTHHDTPHYTQKERFPARSIIGSGFSRLLSSLIPGENGGLTLPRHSSQGALSEFRSPNSSPPPSQASRTPANTLKRRLPKLANKGSIG